jgi:hypothetical protein
VAQRNKVEVEKSPPSNIGQGMKTCDIVAGMIIGQKPDTFSKIKFA